MFLLNGQRQRFESRILRFEDRGVKAIVVLTASVSAEAVKRHGCDRYATHKVNDHPIVFPRRKSLAFDGVHEYLMMAVGKSRLQPR